MRRHLETATAKLLRDSREAARRAHLRYVVANEGGLLRRGRPGHFTYVDAQGRRVKNSATLSRIASLAIPPAWQRVWICASPNGHLQATGYDARGRKQYRYHPEWRAVRDHAKYADIVPFVRSLPRLRRALARDLRGAALTKARVVASVVDLLERTQIRVGNAKYARENDSYGLTTLQNRHARVVGDRLELSFRGKSGKPWSTTLRARPLAKVVKGCRKLPGKLLFQYLDERGKRHKVTSTDVNAYLREHMGGAFSAKEFRTWAGTLLTCKALFGSEPCTSGRSGKLNVARAVKNVAMELGNTPAVCRKSYVDPLLFDCYLAGELHRAFERCQTQARRIRPAELSVDEQTVALLLESLGRGKPLVLSAVGARA
jgi:DNA topoisomerase-1